MARKHRSLRHVNPRAAEIDILGLYEELSPLWRLGSTEPEPAEWSWVIFGALKHHPAARIPRPIHYLKYAA